MLIEYVWSISCNAVSSQNWPSVRTNSSCWFVLDFWKINLEKSSSTNWIFSLFRTAGLQKSIPKLIFAGYLVRRNWFLQSTTLFFKNQVQINRGIVCYVENLSTKVHFSGLLCLLLCLLSTPSCLKWDKGLSWAWRRNLLSVLDFAPSDLQLPLRQYGAGNVYLLVLYKDKG